MPELQPFRIFVSSTRLDLEGERAAVRQVISRMCGTHFVGMEVFGSRPETPHDVSVAEVVRSDLYVGIIGERYGSGITEAEYRAARSQGMPCLLYVKGLLTDRDDRLTTWLNEVQKTHTVTRYRDEQALAASVAADLHNWLYPRLVERVTGAAAEGRLSSVAALLDATVDREALRRALIQKGIAVGEDLLESVLSVTSMVPELLVRGVDELATDYATRIENFVADYLGTPQDPRPFGGRSDAVRELDRWLDDPEQPPYLLVAAEAGRGKSALFVHWSRRLLARDDVHVVFVPVSVRYRTNLAAVFFAALAARLSRVHGEPVAADVGTSPEVWRGLASDQLKRPPRDAKQIVVLIDGLDEAADWEAGADLFPRKPASGVRVAVTARLTAAAPTDRAWREQLGWASTHTARSLHLDPLSPAGVRDVLLGMGFPLAQLGGKVDIVRELHRLSSGDPLLVHLYVTDLWGRGEAAARLEATELERIEPGIDGYFRRWWADQKQLWGSDAPLRERGVRAILNLLACALAPLTRADLLELAPTDADVTTWTLESYVEPIERFVVETAQGLAFNHPRFAQYLYGELTPHEQRQWDGYFLRWGERTTAVLAGRTPGVPTYVIQYYGAHLERAGASVEDMVRLITPAWRVAWESVDGGLTGFLGDIERAAAAALRADDAAFGAGVPPPYLATEIFCAIARASVRSVMEAVPPELLERLLVEHVWRPKQALVYARQLSDVIAKVAALSRVVRFLDAEERPPVVEEAVALNRLLDVSERIEAMTAVVVDGGAPVNLLLDAIRDTKRYWDAPSAVERLIHQGRIEEALAVVRVSDRGFLHDSGCAAIRALTQCGSIDTCERLIRSLPRQNRYRRMAIYLLAVNGHDAAAVSAANTWEPSDPVPSRLVRIGEVARALKADTPFRIEEQDVEWIAELIRCDIESDIAAFLERLSNAVPSPFVAKIAAAIAHMEAAPSHEPTVDGYRSAMIRALRVAPSEAVPSLVLQLGWAERLRDGTWVGEDPVPVAAHGLCGEKARPILLAYFGRSAVWPRSVIASVCAAGEQQTVYDAILALEQPTRQRKLALVTPYLRGDLQRKAVAQLLHGFVDPTLRTETNILAAALPAFTRQELQQLLAVIGRIDDRAFADAIISLMRDERCPEISSIAVEDDEWADIVATMAVTAPEWRAEILRQMVTVPGLRTRQGAVEVVEPLTVTLEKPVRESVRHTLWRELARDSDAFFRALHVIVDPLPEEARRYITTEQIKEFFLENARLGRYSSATGRALRMLPRKTAREYLKNRMKRVLPRRDEIRELLPLLTHEDVAILADSAVEDVTPLLPRMIPEQFQKWLARIDSVHRLVRIQCHALPRSPAHEREAILLACANGHAPDELARAIGDIYYQGDGLRLHERLSFAEALRNVLTPPVVDRLIGSLACDPDSSGLMLLTAAIAEIAPPASSVCARVFRRVFSPATVRRRAQVLLDVAGLRGVLRLMGGNDMTRAAGDAIERAVNVFP